MRINYCNEYVEFLLEDYKTSSQKHFKTNMDIQKNYYGENEVMLDKLSSYINQFLETDTPQRDIITNDILTYFASYKTDYHIKNEYINKIIKKAEVLKMAKLKKICKDIQKLFVEI